MLEQLWTKDGETRVYRDAKGNLLVSVTSAMKLVKELIGEEPDLYGPPALAKVHQAEGTWCHEVCLDWLAFTVGWIPSFEVPKWDPTKHPDERIMRNVVANAHANFMEFVERYEVEPIGIEQEVISVSYGLCGHIDLPCMMTYKKRRVKAIVDLKFVAKLLPSHELQVRCYGRMDTMRDAQIGVLYHDNRSTGQWTIKFVNLMEQQDDVMAVSHAARLYAWAQQKQRV